MSADKYVAARIAAMGIVTRMNRISEIWDTLDYYAEHGSAPVREGGAVKRKIDEMSRPELIRFTLNIKPALSKLRKKVDEEKNAARKAELKAELQMREEEWAELIAIRDAD